jgi:hypothetical protein
MTQQRTRFVYVACHVAYFTASLGSRAVNAIFFGGSMHQTLSARAHVEGRVCPRWRRMEQRIDRLFAIFERDHCANGWAAEVERAIKTLERNGMFENGPASDP